jgi:hypothetical protein
VPPIRPPGSGQPRDPSEDQNGPVHSQALRQWSAAITSASSARDLAIVILARTSSGVLAAFPTQMALLHTVPARVVAAVLGLRACGGAGLVLGPDVDDAVASRVV